MGNQALKAPKTEKITEDGENKNIKFGMCEMQGWRNNMVILFLVIVFFKKGRCNNNKFGL